MENGILIINQSKHGVDEEGKDLFFIDSFVLPTGVKVARNIDTQEPNFSSFIGYKGAARHVLWEGENPVQITNGTVENVTADEFDFTPRYEDL